MIATLLTFFGLVLAAPQAVPPGATAGPAPAATAPVTVRAASPVVAGVARLAETWLRGWRFTEAEMLIGLLRVTAPNTREVVRVHARHLYLMGRYTAAQALLQRHLGPGVQSDLAARVAAAVAVVEPMVTHRSASGSFLIRCPRGTDEILLLYAEAVLERSRVALRDELGLVSDGPVRVEILSGAEDLARVSPLRLEEVRRTGTTGLSQDHRIMLITPRAVATGYGWADTLAHEYVHYVLEVKARHRVPLWLHEGLARFLQQRWREPLPTALEPLQRHRLALGIRDRRLVSLRKMMPSFAKLKDHRQAALAYAQVASMILQLHRAHGSAGLRLLVEGLAAGLGIDLALRGVTGGNLAQFVARWKVRLVAQKLQPVPVYEPQPRQFKQSSGTRPHKRTPFERFRRLGAILRGRARYGAAAVEYRKALAVVNGADADTANTLARVLLRLGKRSEAAQVITRALPYGDQVAALHVVAARAAEGLGKHRRAEEHLWRANYIDPFDPEIHCALSRLLTRRAAPEAARETAVCQQLNKEQ